MLYPKHQAWPQAANEAWTRHIQVPPEAGADPGHDRAGEALRGEEASPIAQGHACKGKAQRTRSDTDRRLAALHGFAPPHTTEDGWLLG